jgi:hypothetical protein
MSRWRSICRGTVSLFVVLTASAAGAAQLALDNASQPAYGDGWQTGDNGGFGFGPWDITLNGGMVGVGTSTANGTPSRRPATSTRPVDWRGRCRP